VAEGQSAQISDLDRNFNFKTQSKSASPWMEIEGSLTLISSYTQYKEGSRGSREEKERKNQTIKLFSGIFQSWLLLFSSIFLNFHYVQLNS